MIPGLPDYAQGLTAVALLLTLLAVIGYMITRERKYADSAKKDLDELTRVHNQVVVDLNAEIKSLYRERFEKAEVNLVAMQAGASVTAEAQKLVRELLPLIDYLKREAGK